MNQAKAHASAAMDQAYGSGRGLLPPMPGTEDCTQWAKEIQQKLFPPPMMSHAIPWQVPHGQAGYPSTHNYSMHHNPPHQQNQGPNDGIMSVCECHFYHTIN
jgi:hypothetical protein